MSVRYTHTALSELADILTYLSERHPAAAQAVGARVRELVALLGEYPFLGQASDEPHVRVIPLVKYPFSIFYALDGEDAVILHIRHSARRRPCENDD